MSTHILVYYGEIGLKGRNRGTFEQQLITNIKQSRAADSFARVKRISGRVLIVLKDGYDRDLVNDVLSRVYGIVYFLWVEMCEQTIDSMIEMGVQQAQNVEFESFAVRARRQDKNFVLSRVDMERGVGGAIDDVVDAKVDLSNPDITFYVVVVENMAFVGHERVEGAGGLPVGVSGRALVLLSGGIDSPIAASLMQKRGCPVDFIHFHNAPYTSEASRDKAVNLARIIAEHQNGSHLFLVPFTDIQKEIVKHTDQRYRILLYRRCMLRMAEYIAKKRRIQVLVTGDSVAQVASQTIENLAAVSGVVDLMVMRPLLGYNKQEVVEIAQQIGTYDESTLPHEDCCSYFMPKSPATHATAYELEKQEELLKIDNVWQSTLDLIEEIKL